MKKIFLKMKPLSRNEMKNIMGGDEPNLEPQFCKLCIEEPRPYHGYTEDPRCVEWHCPIEEPIDY